MPNGKVVTLALAGLDETFVGAVGCIEGMTNWGFSTETALGIDRKAVIGGCGVRWRRYSLRFSGRL